MYLNWRLYLGNQGLLQLCSTLFTKTGCSVIAEVLSTASVESSLIGKKSSLYAPKLLHKCEPKQEVRMICSALLITYRAKKTGRLQLPPEFEFSASLAAAPPLVFHSRAVPHWLNITASHTSLMGSRFLVGKTLKSFLNFHHSSIRWTTTVSKACEATWIPGH